MWNLVICTAERIPQTIREVETRYWVVFASKDAAAAMMIGGVMIPANIASACWNPKSRERTTGMLS
jgi:hypothetical protein